jgi:predicted flap endonuclease-1-like 5' DNA nuclease
MQMLQSLESNQILLAGIVLVVAFVVWWVWGRSKPTPSKREYTDVLSEGAAPAARNNALIDAPSAAALVTPPPGVGTMAGVGEVVAAAAAEEIIEAAPAPAPAPVSEAAGDDLGRIKGVGPKLKALLASLGVTSYAQIAAWTDEDIAKIDAQLGTFAGRARRDNWVEQARLLASGDTAAYEAKFGKV